MLARHVSSPYLNDAFTDSRKKQLLTLKEISRFSPPQMSMPASYWPISLKYFLLIANNPPAIVGDLGGGGRRAVIGSHDVTFVVVRSSASYLIGPTGPLGLLSSAGGTGSHLKCSPQLKPPLTMGEGA